MSQFNQYVVLIIMNNTEEFRMYVEALSENDAVKRVVKQLIDDEYIVITTTDGNPVGITSMNVVTIRAV